MIETVCRVCGWDGEGIRWDDGLPLYVICDCCGTEAGVEDSTRRSSERARREWIGRRYAWFDARARPMAWDPAFADEYDHGDAYELGVSLVFCVAVALGILLHPGWFVVAVVCVGIGGIASWRWPRQRLPIFQEALLSVVHAAIGVFIAPVRVIIEGLAYF